MHLVGLYLVRLRIHELNWSCSCSTWETIGKSDLLFHTFLMRLYPNFRLKVERNPTNIESRITLISVSSPPHCYQILERSSLTNPYHYLTCMCWLEFWEALWPNALQIVFEVWWCNQWSIANPVSRVEKWLAESIASRSLGGLSTFLLHYLESLESKFILQLSILVDRFQC